MKLGERLFEMKDAGKTGFIPYLTAGDPDLEATFRFAWALERAGAAAIELGVPFSDPLADGPVNQRSVERALRNGRVSLGAILSLVRELRASGFALPILLFTYFNPLHRFGITRFAEFGAQAGVSGVVCVDLPPEEASPFKAALGGAAIETIFLLAPTTPAARVPLIDSMSTSAIYYVSRTGVTGGQAELSPGLLEDLSRLRARTRKAVMVGFGISTPEQASRLAGLADAVVVGSALVQLIEHAPAAEAEAAILEFSTRIVESLDSSLHA